MSGTAYSFALTQVVGGLMVLLSIGFADGDHDTAKRLKDSGEIIPLEKILEAVRKEHPGRLLEVELRDQEGRRVYDVELVDKQGVVWYLQYDATWGTLLHVRKGKTP